MKYPLTLLATCLSCLVATAPGLAVTNLSTNPGFDDLDAIDGPGDGWLSFGAAGFNAFFGANAHASFYPDTAGNTGGVFQLGIPAQEGNTYQFDLLNTRIESSFDSRLRFGLEFYAADDATLLGESFEIVDGAERLALPNVDGGGAVNGAVFSAKGVAPVGTSIVRPVVKYDEVNPAYLSQPQANAFVFNSFLSETPSPGGNLLKNPGFGDDVDQNGSLGDVWGFYGTTGVNEFFGDNVHASLFADTAGNTGGFYQQSILAEEGTTYEFELSDVRLESSFDARLQFGLEYYGSDDFTLLSQELVTADTSVTGDGLTFSMQSTAIEGAVYVRPVVLLDEVNPAYLEQPSANAFVFATSLSEAISLPGDYNSDGRVDAADYTVWRDGDSPDNSPAGYDLWANNYGAAPATATTVPEPTSLLLAACVVAAGLGNRRD